MDHAFGIGRGTTSGGAPMSLMVTEVYDALIAAGAPDEKARAAAGVIPMIETLATRQDLAEFKIDFAEFKAEMKNEFAEFKAEVKEDHAEFKGEMKNEFSVLKRDVAVLKLAMFSFLPTILALLVKLAFFP